MATYQDIPRQKLSISKKTKQWKQDCVDAYINISSLGGYGVGFSTRRGELQRLYDFYNGDISENDYDYVLKPYGKTRKNFPSKLRNYPIIKPIIDLLLGEKAKRPFNYTVSVANSDSVSIKEEALNEMIYKNLEQTFINQVNESGADTGVPSQEVEAPEQIRELFNRSYVDNRAIVGQAALNYIMEKQEVHDKLQQAWFHFLISGEVYTERGVRNAEPFYDILNPLDVDYDLDPDLEFVEDGDWAVTRKFMHASTIIDNYYGYLKDSEVDQLESPTRNKVDNFLTYSSYTENSDPFRSNLIEVTTVYWKSRKRVGFLSYIDPNTGQWEEMEVDDGFKMPPELKEIGAKLEWLWVNEAWEGTRIDEDIYIKIEPVVNQRGSIDNPAKCKLPINGRRYSDVNSKNISLVQLGVPYQLNYNIFKYRLELAIARSKDIIAQFDINMIPKKWDMDKFMYYVEGTGIAWVDYNKEGVQLSPQHQSVLDMSIKTIEQYIVLLNSVMDEWEKLSGVNRQRQGQVGSYEGKATSQQAIVQSSHITEDYFKKFQRLEQRDLQAMLDYSKQAWLEGKKGMYVMPDGTTDYLDLESLDHMESEYGIFVTNSGREQDKLMKVEQLAQSMIQNGVPASTVAEMIDTQSFTQLKDKIRKAEDTMQQLAQQQQEAEQQMQQAQMQQREQELQREDTNNEADRINKLEIAQLQSETDITIAEMKLDTEADKIESQERSDRDSMSIERDTQSEARRANTAKEGIDNKNIKSKEKIEKTKAQAKNKPNKSE
tara:strand:+ start:1022 stop:3337 length:2316 start_codon:yes stop_codon:yes gene_type:complete